MSKIASGNWNQAPWQVLRPGVERVIFAMEADGVCCQIGRVENDNEIRPHSHENEQIALVLEGECDYYVDGTPYKLTPGSWVTVPANVEHYIHVHDSAVPCIQMDIFTPDRPEFTESYTAFVNSLKNK
ncbi:cupin domain-containing protein [Fusibacter bizertensis]